MAQYSSASNRLIENAHQPKIIHETVTLTGISLSNVHDSASRNSLPQAKRFRLTPAQGLFPLGGSIQVLRYLPVNVPVKQLSLTQLNDQGMFCEKISNSYARSELVLFSGIVGYIL